MATINEEYILHEFRRHPYRYLVVAAMLGASAGTVGGIIPFEYLVLPQYRAALKERDKIISDLNSEKNAAKAKTATLFGYSKGLEFAVEDLKREKAGIEKQRDEDKASLDKYVAENRRLTQSFEAAGRKVDDLSNRWAKALHAVLVDPQLYVGLNKLVEADLTKLSRFADFNTAELDALKRISLETLESPIVIAHNLLEHKLLLPPTKSRLEYSIPEAFFAVKSKLERLPDQDKGLLKNVAKSSGFEQTAPEQLKGIIKSLRGYQKSFLIKYKVRLNRLSELLKQQHLRDRLLAEHRVTSKALKQQGRQRESYQKRTAVSARTIAKTMRRRFA